jgi:hypothetical protein
LPVWFDHDDHFDDDHDDKYDDVEFDVNLQGARAVEAELVSAFLVAAGEDPGEAPAGIEEGGGERVAAGIF